MKFSFVILTKKAAFVHIISKTKIYLIRVHVKCSGEKWASKQAQT